MFLAFLYILETIHLQVTHWRRYEKKIGKDLKEIPHQASVIRLRSSREIDAFLASI